MPGTRLLRATTLGGVIAVVGAVLLAPSAQALPSNGDITDAMVYGSSGPIGSVISDLTGEDDQTSTIAAPFPINFFGTKYDGFCITTNGGLYPVATSSHSCSDAYDKDLDHLAQSSQAPMIAALGVDLDLGNSVYRDSEPMATIADDGSELTVATASPNGLTVGDPVILWFDAEDADYGTQHSSTVQSVISSTQFTVASQGSTFAARPAVGHVVSHKYANSTDDSDGDGLADDGFGAVAQIYEGTTTINGQDAWVLTWYRVPNYDDANDPALTNTFQIVLLKEPTANASTAGYDFTIEYNYGLVQDGDDGYSAADPGNECESGDADCRWAVGWVNYIPGSNPNDPTDGATTDPYELFAGAQVPEILDGGAKALTSNSLNTSVRGRYIFKMIGGQTVGFSVPTLDGTQSSAPASTPTSTTTTDPLAPVQPATEAVGYSAGTENSVAVPVTVSPTADRKGVVMTGSGFTMTFVGASSTGSPFDIDSDGNLVLSTTGSVQVSGTGFAPNTQVKVYLFSTPTQLGTTTTNSSGAFSASFPLPSGISAGVHTVQASGYTTGNVVRTLSLGVRVTGPALASTGFDAVPLAAGGGIVLLLGAALMGAGRFRSRSPQG